MSEEAYIVRGMHFEEFEVGFSARSPGRTVTETDIVQFAGLTGDYNPLHTDEEFAQASHFEGRVAHGLLGLTFSLGLLSRLGFLDGTVLAFMSLEWKFSLPVYIGDTIHATVGVAKTRAMKRLGGGVVDFEVNVVNQAGKTVQKGKWRALLKGQEAS